MKSTRENKPFSLEDIEKGLMLAGMILPGTVNDLNERLELEAFEKKLKSKKSQVYFKRSVLAAEIVSELHNEATFGRVKFQKLVYLCEHAANLDLKERYDKQVAGPFDRKFMHGIENEFKKQKWFRVDRETDGAITRSKYLPLENCDNYKQYYGSYFKDSVHLIKKIIDLLRKKKTDFTEIAATLFACYCEIKEKELQFNEDKLLTLFYAWSERKERFDKKVVLSTWQWLKDNELVQVNTNQ